MLPQYWLGFKCKIAQISLTVSYISLQELKTKFLIFKLCTQQYITLQKKDVYAGWNVLTIHGLCRHRLKAFIRWKKEKGKKTRWVFRSIPKIWQFLKNFARTFISSKHKPLFFLKSDIEYWLLKQPNPT